MRRPVAEALSRLASFISPLASFSWAFRSFTCSGGSTPVLFGVFEVFFTGRGEQRLQFGESRVLPLQLGQHLRELALQDVFVGDQLGAPAAGGDGLEVGRKMLVSSWRRRRAPGSASAGRWPPKTALDAFQQRGAQRIDIACRGVLVVGIRRQCIDHRQVRLPPVLQLRHEVGLALQHAGVLRDVGGDGALVGQRGAEVGIGAPCRLPRAARSSSRAGPA